MQTVSQRSHQSRTWFDAAVVDNGDGTLAIAASTFWLHDMAYALAAYLPSVGSGPFRIYIENDGGAADYLLDTTGAAVPQAFGPSLGAPAVIWRDADGDEVHVLRSTQDA